VDTLASRCTGRWARLDRLTLGALRGWWAQDIVVVARRAQQAGLPNQPSDRSRGRRS
jgi:hypothetical protein